MAAGRHNLKIEKGATFTLPLTWKNENGSLVNLTGYTARMDIRSAAGAVTAIAQLTSSSGITLGGTAGTIVVTLSAATTAAITDTSGVYDLELVSAGGVVTRLLEGSVEFVEEVTA